MPVARIYASSVEEAEPICADLLARGYHVEVVFPDAVLSTPADLELRVERCSAEQAIARVEAAGSPARCVFVTQGKGPRGELLLVEMTVLANGTDARHPIAMPSLTRVAVDPAISVALIPPPNHPRETSVESPVATILPFPDSPPASQIPDETEVRVGELTGTDGPPAQRGRDEMPRDEMPSKSMMVELNAFLAHAPVVERPDGLHVKIFENVRHSAGVARARKNWQGLTLAAVAAGFLLLLSLGWYAAPDRPQRTTAGGPVPAASPVAAAAVKERAPSAPPARVRLMPASLETQTAATISAPSSTARAHRSVQGQRLRYDDFVAEDRVVRFARQTPNNPTLAKVAPKIAPNVAPRIASELTRPTALQSARMAPAPIKRITDLK